MYSFNKKLLTKPILQNMKIYPKPLPEMCYFVLADRDRMLYEYLVIIRM